MKKIFIVFLLSLTVLITGCEKVEEQGNYKEGTYFGYAQEESYGEVLTTTATIYVDKNGMLKSVFIDATYVKDGKITTKKTLGDDYDMKETSANIGNIPGGAEWYEQINTLEEKIIEEQGTSFIKWSSDDSTKLDSVSGVTISVDNIIKAVDNALNQAK